MPSSGGHVLSPDIVLFLTCGRAVSVPAILPECGGNFLLINLVMNLCVTLAQRDDPKWGAGKTSISARSTVKVYICSSTAYM